MRSIIIILFLIIPAITIAQTKDISSNDTTVWFLLPQMDSMELYDVTAGMFGIDSESIEEIMILKWQDAGTLKKYKGASGTITFRHPKRIVKLSKMNVPGLTDTLPEIFMVDGKIIPHPENCIIDTTKIADIKVIPPDKGSVENNIPRTTISITLTALKPAPKKD